MPPQQNQEDPYEFITNPEKPSRMPINFGNTQQQRIIIVGVGLVLLIIIFIVLYSLFTRASNEQKDNLIDLAQTQTEIIRVAEIADEKSNNIDTRALAINARYSLQTDLQETKEFLAKRGIELKDKSLVLKKDESTDKELEDAAASNQFDEAFTETLKEQLQNYRLSVQKAYESGSPFEQQALSQDYQEIALLL